MTPRSRHGYPWRALGLDYAGAAAGLAVSAALLVFVRLAAPVGWVVAGSAALFLVYFGRTVCRQLTHIELDEAGIRVVGPALVPSRAAIRWDDLRALRLEYYSTRADREGGWMQLKLGDGQRTIRIDSGLEGFAQVAERAALEAARLDLALDAGTLNNLLALRS
ncbi:MAG TPA: hypothetical protein VI229_02085 [Burkholderiales bacterium]